MKSTVKKTLFVFMTMLLLTALPINGYAKRKVKRRSVTITSGSTYTFTIRNIKKASWKTNNKKIVSLSVKKKGQKAIFTGKKAGKTKVTATTKNVKYIFNVTVKASRKKNTKSTSGKVSYHMKGNENVMVFYVKNTYSIPKKVTIKTKFYNKKGKKIATGSCTVLCLGPKQKTALGIIPPSSFASFKNTMTVSDSSHKSRAKKIKFSSKSNSNSVTVSVSNKSGKNLKKLKIGIVYYNSNGKEIGYKSARPDCTAKSSSDSVTLAFPKNKNNKTLVPASYKIYVVHAY